MKIGMVLAEGNHKSRRGLLLGLAGLSAVAWGWQRFVHHETAPIFAPIPGLPGWRQMETGLVSSGSAAQAVFLGLDDVGPPPMSADALCGFLYPAPGTTPNVAFFTDIQCPNCRSLDTKLLNRRDRLTLNRIELPLLGPRSETVAKANVAALLQTDPDAPEVAAQLDRNHAAAQALGIWGTPAMTIGKTLVMGDLSADRLDALLALDHPACG